jgi:hypothetical protein
MIPMMEMVQVAVQMLSPLHNPLHSLVMPVMLFAAEVAASIVSAIAGLIGGAMSGAGKKAAEKREYETWLKKRGQEQSDVQKYLKPELGRVNYEQNAGSFGDTLDRLLMGRAGEQVSTDRASSMGLNFQDILASLGTAQRDTNSWDSTNPWGGRTPPSWVGGETTYGGPGGVPAANGAWAPAGAGGAVSPGVSGGPGGGREDQAYINDILRKYGIGA